MECHEGCFCPVGMVEEDGECIHPSDCPCYEEHARYPSGTFKHQDCQDCVCINGTFECKGEKCVNETTCGPDQYTCLSGECIAKKFVCDGKPDCMGGSDEANCNITCGAAEFRCLDGRCIPSHYACDGTPDCFDGSDELGPECKPKVRLRFSIRLTSFLANLVTKLLSVVLTS